jgi:glycosyltransferase involved in cell wall biosynthesis
MGIAGFNPIVGYVGTRPWERGGMQLIETAPRLIAKFPTLGIVILGDGNELELMKEKADKLGVGSHCVFTGYVPFHKIPLYINSLDVGVSINLRPDRYAASELKVRQYLACGKPVVVSPGSNDFVAAENLGSIVQPTDLDAIAAVLEKWLSMTSDERNDFSDRAAQYVENNLSIDAAVSNRFKLWSERLQTPRLEYIHP